MKDDIEHDGIIESFNGESVLVRITQTSACAECKAKSLCQSTESKVKTIEAKLKTDYQSTKLSVGDHVKVIGTTKMGNDAILLAFILPLIIIIGCLIICIKFIKIDELTSILLMIGTLSLYYIILYLFRKKIANKFVFMIR